MRISVPAIMAEFDVVCAGTIDGDVIFVADDDAEPPMVDADDVVGNGADVSLNTCFRFV